MVIDKKLLEELQKKYGDTFYILDTEQFNSNYFNLENALKKYYSNSHISYSYKTNYIPRLCDIIKNNGGYAEVVSDMECEIALRLGVEPKKIYYNGPYKRKETLIDLIKMGVNVNIDSEYDFNIIKNYIDQTGDKVRIGIRCNFDIGDDIISRFGFDVNSKEFETLLEDIRRNDNINVVGLHCHFATRDIKYWPNKVKGLLEIAHKRFDDSIEYLCFGGGIFGNIEESLKKQFSQYIPSYNEYAEIIGKLMAETYGKMGRINLLIEPGSALVGDVMKFVSKVVNIKEVRGRNIATLSGSVYNINPTLNGKNPPIEIIEMGDFEQKTYELLDMGGYTCIESDYLYRNYTGKCAVGDCVIFSNVGSYSVVLKPPFILPNCPVLEINKDEINLIKKQETFDDIFRTYIF